MDNVCTKVEAGVVADILVDVVEVVVGHVLHDTGQYDNTAGYV